MRVYGYECVYEPQIEEFIMVLPPVAFTAGEILIAGLVLILIFLIVKSK